MCGTPNYIAPEVLARTGHGIEVDNWAIGVILYALLVGTPPFETKAVETTYEKIRKNEYSFPEETPLSEVAKDLISRILVPEPEKRLSIRGIREHCFCSGNTAMNPRTVLEEIATSTQNGSVAIGATTAASKPEVAVQQDGVMTRRRRRESLMAASEEVAAKVAEDEGSPNGRKRKRTTEPDTPTEGDKRQATNAKVAALQKAASAFKHIWRVRFYSHSAPFSDSLRPSIQFADDSVPIKARSRSIQIHVKPHSQRASDD